jgi:Got1/Sft2-like family
MSFMSFRFFVHMIEGNPLPFAFNYTVGQIMQLLASMFLCGPKQQFKNMFDEKRRQTSITYLSCLALTLVLIFIPMPAGLKLFLLLCSTLTQFCASLWYTLSYIPYGRRTALRMIKNTLGIDDSTYAGVMGST